VINEDGLSMSLWRRQKYYKQHYFQNLATNKMASVTDLQSTGLGSTVMFDDESSTETFDVKTPEDDAQRAEQPPGSAVAGDKQEDSYKDVELATEAAAVGGDPTAETQDEVDEKPPQSSLGRRIWNRCCLFYNNNDFVVMIVISILLARAYPPLGADYLQPEITSTWIAVIFIFGTYTY
jgi:hypothetical protein